MIIKGILHPDEAKQALVRGVDGVIVSNHGGRQLDVHAWRGHSFTCRLWRNDKETVEDQRSRAW